MILCIGMSRLGCEFGMYMWCEVGKSWWVDEKFCGMKLELMVLLVVVDDIGGSCLGFMFNVFISL